MASISVVIPVYRAAESLPKLRARLMSVLEQLQCTFEVVFVEDCGGDNSWEVIQQICRDDARFRGIKLSRNYGQHNALLCGIKAAKHEIIITMDDDLQNPPEEIPLLLAELDKGFDVVYGAPKKERHGFLRDMASRMTKIALQGAMGVETAKDVSAYRAFRTQIRESFQHYRSPNVNIDVLLTWGTTRFIAIKVKHDTREIGQSGYSWYKLFTHAFNMITGFTTLPLQIASFVGFLFALLGGVILIYVLGNYLINGAAVAGFSFLASMIAVFSGVQLMTLGVFGEYLARIHFRTMDRPPYSVQEKTAD